MLFETKSNLPMFYFTEGGSLKVQQFEPQAVIPNEELFTEVSHPCFQDSTVSLALKVNVLLNEVTKRTRRGPGNVVWVQAQSLMGELEASMTLYKYTVVVDSTLAPNELRATHWLQRSVNDHPVAVSGGVQVTPDGVVYNPNWSQYFVRCFV